MVSKRKSKGGGSSSADKPEIKKVKLDPTDDTAFCNSALKSIAQLTDDDGRSIDELFKKLPPKKIYPDYYKVIEEPISLNEIQQKVNKSQYGSLDEFLADFRLMEQNATTFNEKGSAVANDAEAIYEHVEKLVQEQQSFVANYQTMIDALEELIDYKVKGKQLSDWFMVEPSSEDYPDYREIIEEPMSFTTARAKVEAGDVRTLEDFKNMVQLIFSNSKQYNTEDSIVYADTEALEKVFHQKMDKLLKKNGTKLKISMKKEAVSDQDIEMKDASTQEEAASVTATTGDEINNEDEENGNEEDENDDEKAAEELRREAIDEVRTREPGKTVADALIKCLSVTSSLPQQSKYQQAKALPPHLNDMFQLSIPASKVYTIQSHTFMVPQYHHTINVNILLNQDLNDRYYQIQLNHNARKVPPLSSPPLQSLEERPLSMKFDIRLTTGLNQIEVLCQAAPPNPRGHQRSTAAPPQNLSQDDFETEKFILWVVLART